ncbi:MAG: acyl-CoA/acyl-ACP dehydrogenase [Steroidobacteraceae bacterium]|jgi:acyl-CoA dehydrogenase|nr:acyl-CoA/acyl-ACP dehydrogenase [Steroidobacteraceae bacterium]
MVDFALTDEQRMYQDTARAFAREKLRPVADAIRARDAARQTPWDLFRPVFAEASQLGFTRLLIPEAYGGVGGSCLDNVIVMEEFGAADVGLAASFLGVSATAPMLILRGADEQQKRRWLGEITSCDDFVLASASSEPSVSGADSFSPDPSPSIGLRTLARRDGDHYVLHGTKAGFSTNAGAARAFFIMARTDLAQPAFASTSLFYVPADAPGLTVGRKTELIGWKTAMHAEVYLDEVRVPVGHRIGAEGSNMGLFFMHVLPYLGSGLAAAYVGLARAALDYALDYAHQRISWGKPIVEHQAVALKLADMAADLEAARLLVWKVAWAADRGDPEAAGLLSPIAKTTAVQAAIRNAERAMRILGGYGVAADYETGRMLADAWVGDSCDGTHDLLRLSTVPFMRMARGYLQPPGGGPPAHGGPPPGVPAGAPRGMPPGAPAPAPAQ